MNTISVQLPDGKNGYQPGEKLQGVASWALDVKTRSIELRLFWVASGVSPQQVGMVERRVLSRPGRSGTESFQFMLPNGPWSYQGAMLSVDWHVEAVAIPSLASGRVSFVVSPTGRPMTTKNLLAKERDEAEKDAGEGEWAPPVAGH